MSRVFVQLQPELGASHRQCTPTLANRAYRFDDSLHLHEHYKRAHPTPNILHQLCFRWYILHSIYTPINPPHSLQTPFSHRLRSHPLAVTQIHFHACHPASHDAMQPRLPLRRRPPKSPRPRRRRPRSRAWAARQSRENAKGGGGVTRPVRPSSFYSSKSLQFLSDP